MDLEHRLGGESLSASTAVGDEVGVAGVEIGGRRASSRMAPMRGVMLWSIIHRYRLAVWRVRSPLVASQVVAMNPAHAEFACWDRPLTVDASLDRDGVGAVGAGGMPSAPFASGDRVVAVVGDDVEAMVALNDVGHLCPSALRVVNPKINRRHHEALWGPVTRRRLDVHW